MVYFCRKQKYCCFCDAKNKMFDIEMNNNKAPGKTGSYPPPYMFYIIFSKPITGRIQLSVIINLCYVFQWMESTVFMMNISQNEVTCGWLGYDTEHTQFYMISFPLIDIDSVNSFCIFLGDQIVSRVNVLLLDGFNVLQTSERNYGVLHMTFSQQHFGKFFIDFQISDCITVE